MNKSILITGTRKGIGKNLAEYYLNKGFLVFGCSRKKSSIIHKNYEHFCLDICNELEVINMIRNIKKNYGKIDILINNAGIASMNHIITTPIQSVKNIMNVNFLGSFLLLREVAKVMIKNKFGRIINFSTIAVPLRIKGEAIYASSKSAIITLTEIAAKELADFNITVNAIAPTLVKTDLIRGIPEKKINEILNLQAIKRFASIEDIVNVIDFFINEKSSFITGQTIYLGGITR